jgi:hypothetical protein
LEDSFSGKEIFSSSASKKPGLRRRLRKIAKMNYDFSFISGQRNIAVRVKYGANSYGPQEASYYRHAILSETERETELEPIKPRTYKFYLDALYVHTLDISCNVITVITSAFSEFGILRKIFAQNNELMSLPRDFEKLVALKEIDLSNNRFSAFPQELLALKQLEVLDLSENNLTALPRELITFEEMTNLFVRSNNLEWLPIELRDWGAQIYVGGNCFAFRPCAYLYPTSHNELLGIFGATKHIGMIRHAAGTVCIAMQNWNLPALLMLLIIDELFENDIRMWAKWELITAVKHFHMRNGVKHD